MKNISIWRDALCSLWCLMFAVRMEKTARGSVETVSFVIFELINFLVIILQQRVALSLVLYLYNYVKILE